MEAHSIKRRWQPAIFMRASLTSLTALSVSAWSTRLAATTNRRPTTTVKPSTSSAHIPMTSNQCPKQPFNAGSTNSNPTSRPEQSARSGQARRGARPRHHHKPCSTIADTSSDNLRRLNVRVLHPPGARADASGQSRQLYELDGERLESRADRRRLGRGGLALAAEAG